MQLYSYWDGIKHRRLRDVFSDKCVYILSEIPWSLGLPVLYEFSKLAKSLSDRIDSCSTSADADAGGYGFAGVCA